MEPNARSIMPAPGWRTLSFSATLALTASLSLTPPAAAQGWNGREIPVMTRNLYLGASLDGVMMAGSPMELALAVTTTWQAVQDTDFPARAEVLADEIAQAGPWLIGLQEAALWRIQSPGDLIVGGTVPATQVVYDYVEILLGELAERGMHYEVLVTIDQLDAELPTLTPTYDDVRLTDRDVILARTDLPPGLLQVTGTESGHFNTLLQIPVAGTSNFLTVYRGWVAADIWAHGRSFRFLNAHLETETFPPLQHAQAAELLAGPADVSTAVVLVGDFNSDALGTTTGSYGMFLASGFTDAWSAVHPGLPGLTWGHDADLRNTTVAFTQRIDLVLFRGRFEPTWADLFGEELGDRTPSGLWGSDHAGLAVRLRFRGRL